MQVTRCELDNHEKKSGRLLLAEDNEINQLVAIGVLQLLGYSCDAVPDGRLAVEAIGRGGYDLVLMDCQMPEMDGFAATLEIRKTEKAKAALGGKVRVPIIALTGSATKGDRERCLEAGMDDYVTKPIEPARLAEVIERHLARVRDCRDAVHVPEHV